MFYDLFCDDDVLADDCANVVPDLSRLLSDDELTEILPEGSPYAEAVILDGEELTPDMALIVASELGDDDAECGGVSVYRLVLLRD